MIEIGIKTDPIETRYSFDWLFAILEEEGIRWVQLGSFYELYFLEESWFRDLRRKAEKRGLQIKSVFTAHRELGGFFYGDRRMEQAARKGYERLIQAAVWVGAEYCGSNPGAVYRDRMAGKDKGIRCYLEHMKELVVTARKLGLKALTMEPMSCLAEPPTTPEEMAQMCGEMACHHQANPDTTIPVYLCGDISHGFIDAGGKEVYSNLELFRAGIPWMCEFHFKNTDARYNSTFGFSEEELSRGVVQLEEIREILDESRHRCPVDDLIGYLEIGGPKVGRDYSDPQLEGQLRDSLRALKEVFGNPEAARLPDPS